VQSEFQADRPSGMQIVRGPAADRSLVDTSRNANNP
jgi:hypothetical protein